MKPAGHSAGYCRTSSLMRACTSCALALVMFMSAGAPARAETRLAEPWVDRSFVGTHDPFKRMLIIGVPDFPDKRRQLEDTLAGVLSKNDVEAIASLDLMPPDTEINKENVLEAIEGRGVDSVLVTVLFRVDDIEVVKIDDPGTKRSERDFALGLWRDFRDTYDYRLDAPVDQQHRMVLENNLYDVETAELVWSVQSYSMDPKSADEIIESLSKLVTAQLRKEDLI